MIQALNGDDQWGILVTAFYAPFFFFFLILQTFVKLCFLSGILYLLMKAKLTKKWSATTTKSTDVVQCSSGNNMQIWVKCATLNLSSNVIYCSVLYWRDNSVSKCYFTDDVVCKPNGGKLSSKTVYADEVQCSGITSNWRWSVTANVGSTDNILC